MPIMVLEETQALRAPNGRMLAPLPGGAPPITSETSRDMIRRRVEKYRLKTNKRIAELISAETAKNIKDGSEAFAEIAAAQAKALFKATNPKLDDVVKLKNIMTGESPETSRRENGGTPGAIVAQPAALAELVMLLEQDRRQEIAKAQAIDGESNG